MTNNIFTETGKPFGQYTPIPGHDADYCAGIQALDIYGVTGGARELMRDAWTRLHQVYSQVSLQAHYQKSFDVMETALDLRATLDTIDEAVRIFDNDDIDAVEYARLMRKPITQARLMLGCLTYNEVAVGAARDQGDNLGAIRELVRDALGPVRKLADDILTLQGAESLRKANGTWKDSAPIAQPSATDVAAAEEHARIVTEEQQHWLDRQKA